MGRFYFSVGLIDYIPLIELQQVILCNLESFP
jgi:hypothetical protein